MIFSATASLLNGIIKISSVAEFAIPSKAFTGLGEFLLPAKDNLV